MRTRDMIRQLKYARSIHEDWAAYLRSAPVEAASPPFRPLQEIVGEPEWHDHWIAVYDTALKVLEKSPKEV